MKKVYEAHEMAYQNLKKREAESWREMYATEKGKQIDHIGINRQRFMEDVLTEAWSPVNGKALEIGCGTGHLIRWINSKGFNGTGIDISSTAIEMAKEQSKGIDIDFIKDDYCYSNTFKEKQFDLIIDASCFHCIVEEHDRKAFLEKSFNLLKENGVFILFSMCSPINKKNFAEKFKTEKFKNKIFYVLYNVELEGSKMFNGKLFMPQRKIEHWTKILKALKNTGFVIKLFRYEQESVFSNIYIAAVKK